MAIHHLEEQRAWMRLTPKQKRAIMSEKESLTIINGNGEDVTHRYDVGIKVTQQQSYGKQTVEELAKHETENGGYVFAFFNACRTMEEEFPQFNQSDLARLMFIGTYVAWETGQLKHDNGVPINKKTLEQLVGMSRNKFGEFYKKALQSDIIREEGTDLYVNPGYFYRGRLQNVKEITKSFQYTRLFRKTVRDLYAMYNGRTIKQLALIYAVLPFVNFKYNIIAYNPDESNYDLIQPMELDKLATLLGYQSSKKLSTALRGIKYEGQPVFGFFDASGKKKKVVINPRVVYAGDGKNLEAIRILFK